ncbi:MAG: transcription antitermination factor NusB [Pseudomonadota bacterium]
MSNDPTGSNIAPKQSKPKPRSAGSVKDHRAGGRGEKNKRPAAGQGQKPRSDKSDKRPRGEPSRDAALHILMEVLHNGVSLSEAAPKLMQAGAAYADLDPRDKAFARAAATTALRYARPLTQFTSRFMTKPLANRHRRIDAILLLAAAQILELETAPHAVISIAVDQARVRRTDAHLDKLVNAVLRRVAENRSAWLDVKQEVGPAACLPDWMWARWQADYGEDLAKDIAAASLKQAALDITVKSDPDQWAEKLASAKLETGTLRLSPGGRIEDLPGFADGAWWVQDAASALPATLFGDIASQTVLDLCAAPGGKTAQLAASGANVIAVDSMVNRVRRLRENLDRLDLSAQCIEADVLEWRPDEPVRFVLLDAPCSATGTLRRHPDILHLKRETDQKDLVTIQARFLTAAFGFLAPGGTLLYCTCALEKAEGEQQVRRFLERTPTARRVPFESVADRIPGQWLNEDGDIRILPTFSPPTKPAKNASPTISPDDSGPSVPPDGIDGFFIARITRVSQADD